MYTKEKLLYFLNDYINTSNCTCWLLFAEKIVLGERVNLAASQGHRVQQWVLSFIGKNPFVIWVFLFLSKMALFRCLCVHLCQFTAYSASNNFGRNRRRAHFWHLSVERWRAAGREEKVWPFSSAGRLHLCHWLVIGCWDEQKSESLVTAAASLAADLLFC